MLIQRKVLNKGVLLYIHFNLFLALLMALILFVSGMETATHIKVLLLANKLCLTWSRLHSVAMCHSGCTAPLPVSLCLLLDVGWGNTAVCVGSQSIHHQLQEMVLPTSSWMGYCSTHSSRELIPIPTVCAQDCLYQLLLYRLDWDTTIMAHQICTFLTWKYGKTWVSSCFDSWSKLHRIGAVCIRLYPNFCCCAVAGWVCRVEWHGVS